VRNLFLGVAAAVAALPWQPLSAQRPPIIPVSTFAALPKESKPLLAPDGRLIVARSTSGDEAALVIIDADNPAAPLSTTKLGKFTLAGVHWAGSRKLVLSLITFGEVFGLRLPMMRAVLVDLVTGKTLALDRRSRGLFAGDVLYTDPTGTWALIAGQDDIHSTPSVKRVDLLTGDTTVIEKARPDVWDWFADDDGVVRAGIAYSERRWTIWYREKAGDKLQAVRGKVQKEDGAIDRVMFGKGENGWIITNERTGRFALYSYDFKTGALGDTIFEHPEVDLEDVVYDRFAGKIIAINYHDDRHRTKWLDPERRALQERLDKALPANVNMVTSWSSDAKRALVWSGGASDPGRYFLLDRASSRMHPVVDPYPLIEPSQLAESKWVRYQARDGLPIPAYLTLPRGRPAQGLPLIVMPHGGPFARDEWSYDATVQFLANRGYAVLQPQFRGSTGYGKDFVTRGYGEFGKKMQDDLDDGVDWLVRSGQIDSKRVCIVGASYGGYAAMWGAARNPERYRCAASWAGISDLRALLRHDRKLFSAPRYYREWRTQVGGEGKLDLMAVSPISFADRIKVPVFIAHGEKDERVPLSQSRNMAEAMKRGGADVTATYYKDSGHDFQSNADFEDWLRRLEAFLAKHNPA